MLRALAVAAALALAGCRVDVEGAPCRAAGDPGDCPAGQSCGSGHRCSFRAAACAPCEPGVVACRGGDRARCTTEDPDCGGWRVEAACGALRCSAAAGYTCQCPPPGAVLAVDPSAAGTLPPGAAPNGSAAPAACRLASLSGALGAAALSAGPATPVTVVAMGGGGGATVTFSAGATGEQFPLVVPPGTTLSSDAATSGARYEIAFDPSVPGTAAALVLEGGAALGEVRVRNVSGGASNDAVRVACAAGDPPVLLRGTELLGEGSAGARLGRGLVAAGRCGIVATALAVSGMAGEGLALDPPDPAVAVTLEGGALVANGAGIDVRGGRLALVGTEIRGSAGAGLLVNVEALGVVRVELRGAKITGNGDGGIVATNPDALLLDGTVVHGNSAATRWGQDLPFPSGRRAGGLVLQGAPPAAGVGLRRSRVYGNAGDQILVLSSVGTWSLGPPEQACVDGQGVPVFSDVACYDPEAAPSGQPTYRGLTALAARVTALVGWDAAALTARDVAMLTAGSLIDATPWCTRDGPVSCAAP